MFGKIVPYVIVGFVQATLIVGIGILLFGVPIPGMYICWRCCRRCSSPPICRLAVIAFDHRAEPAPGDAAVDDVLPKRAFCCPDSCFRSLACRSGRSISARPLLTHYIRIVWAIMSRVRPSNPGMTRLH